MPRILSVLLLLCLFLGACEGIIPRPLHPDSFPNPGRELEEKEKNVAFFSDSLNCDLYRSKIDAIRKLLPDPKTIKPYRVDAHFTVPGVTDEFPLFTYEYFMHDSGYQQSCIDLFHLPHTDVPLTRAERDHAHYESREWDKFSKNNYLFIFYPKSITCPTMAGEKSFNAGSIDGTMVVVNLATTNIECSFRFKAESSTFALITEYDGLTKDFVKDIRRTLEEKNS